MEKNFKQEDFREDFLGKNPNRKQSNPFPNVPHKKRRREEDKGDSL